MWISVKLFLEVVTKRKSNSWDVRTFSSIVGNVFNSLLTTMNKRLRTSSRTNNQAFNWSKNNFVEFRISQGLKKAFPSPCHPIHQSIPQDLFWLLQCWNCMCYFQFVPGLQEFKCGHKCRPSLPCKCDRVYLEEWRQHGISVPLPRLLFTDRVKISTELTGENPPLQQMVGNESNETTVSL